MPAEPKRKPRAKPGPYKAREKRKESKDAPATSAVQQVTTKDHLTLRDWMTVFAYIDSHHGIGQEQVVKHFATKQHDALHFTQPTLSRKVKMRAELEARAQSYPNALSTKRARIVTRPNVERALVLWFQPMAAKRETVSGPMLKEKRRRSRNLRRLRAQLRHAEMKNSKQGTLDKWWGPAGS
jgi:hypothetical protein